MGHNHNHIHKQPLANSPFTHRSNTTIGNPTDLLPIPSQHPPQHIYGRTQNHGPLQTGINSAAVTGANPNLTPATNLPGHYQNTNFTRESSEHSQDLLDLNHKHARSASIEMGGSAAKMDPRNNGTMSKYRDNNKPNIPVAGYSQKDNKNVADIRKKIEQWTLKNDNFNDPGGTQNPGPSTTHADGMGSNHCLGPGTGPGPGLLGVQPPQTTYGMNEAIQNSLTHTHISDPNSLKQPLTMVSTVTVRPEKTESYPQVMTS